MKFTESIYGFAALTFEKKLRATKNTCFLWRVILCQKVTAGECQQQIHGRQLTVADVGNLMKLFPSVSRRQLKCNFIAAQCYAKARPMRHTVF